MVSFASCKQSSKSHSFFAPAKLFAGFLFLVLVLHGSSSLPVNKRQTTEEDSTVNIRKQLYWSISLLTRINTHGIVTSMAIPREVINNVHPIVSWIFIYTQWLARVLTIHWSVLACMLIIICYTLQMNNLNTTVMCDMHDFYRDYTTALSTIQTDTSTTLHVKADYSAAQYVALQSMQSACQWVRETKQ